MSTTFGKTLRFSLALVLALGTFGGISPAGTAVAATVPYRSIAIVPDVGGSVWSPGTMVTDAAGRIYVADTGNDRIRVLGSDGALLLTVGRSGSGSGELREPEAVTVGSDGTMYVADTKNSRISVFAADGRFLRSFSQGLTGAPYGIALDDAGVLYVSDRGSRTVKTFSAEGTPLGTYGTPGTDVGQVDFPWGVATGNGMLFVADSNNDVVHVYDLATHGWLADWGRYTVTAGTFSDLSQPKGLSFAPDGTLLIADSGKRRIDQFSMGGTRLAYWSVEPDPATPVRPGTFFPAQIDLPRGMVITSGGAMLVADSGYNRISRWSGGAWLDPWVGSGSTPGLLSSEESLAADDSGGYWVADTANSRIVHYSASGSVIRSIGSSGTAPGQFRAPAGVAVGPDGLLYVADTGNNRVQRIAADGSPTVIGAADLLGPRGLSFDAAGDLFVADTGNSRVAVFSAGVFSRSIGTSGTAAAQFSAPRDVLVDARGILWVADTGNNRVQTLRARDGAPLTIIGGFGTTDGMFFAPTGLAAVPGGDVLVADSGNDRLQRFDIYSQLVAVVGRHGEQPGPFHRPVDACVTSTGRTLVAEKDAHRVQVLAQDVTPPTTGIAGLPSEPTSLSVQFTLDATDGDAGVASTWYRLNSGTVIPYAGDVGIDAEGVTAIDYWSVDRAGNVESFNTTEVVIDRTPPSGAVVADCGAYTRSRDVTLSAAITGATDMRLGYGDVLGDWTAFGASPVVTLPATEGDYVITAAFRDVAGNVSTETVGVTYDVTTPSTTILGIPSGPASDDVAFTLDAADAFSGVVEKWYRVDSGVDMLYTGDPVLLSAEGLTTVHYWSVDGAGNVESENSTEVVIDHTAPYGTIALVGGRFTRSRTVTLDSSQLAGASWMSVAVDGGAGEWAPFAPSVDIELPDNDGEHVITAAYRDLAGNTTTKTVKVMLDRVVDAPVASSPTHPAGQLVRGGTLARLTWQEPSDLTGVTGYSIALDRDPNRSLDAIANVTSATTAYEYANLSGGTWYFHVRAVDAAGNWSPTTTVRIDLTSPLPLGKPRVTSISAYSRSGRRVAIRGSVSPSDATGAHVRIWAFRRERGVWRLKRTTSAAVTSYGGGPATYRGGVLLSAGLWRVYATHDYDGVFEPSASLTTDILVRRR